MCWKLTNLYTVIFVLGFSLLSQRVHSNDVHYLYWNHSNPIFSTNTDNRITVNLFDSIDVFCPYYPPNSNKSTWEYYVIYFVSKEEYEQCTLFEPNKSLMIINCSNPSQSDIFFTIWMDPFQGFPNQPDFSSGESYYMLTTSTGGPGGLSNQYKEFSACYKKNMRLRIDICCTTNSTISDSTTSSSTTQGGQTQPPPTTRQPTTTSTTTTPRPTTSTPAPTTKVTPQPTKFPGGQPSDPSFVIEATGSKNSGLINKSLTLRPSLTCNFILVLVIILISLLRR